MKFALIGCGRVAVNHVKAVVENKLEMVAACDLDLIKIDDLFRKTGFTNIVKKYTDYKRTVSYTHLTLPTNREV